MEFIKEYLDEKTNEYILEYNVSKEELDALEELSKKLGKSIDEITNEFLEKCISDRDFFEKFVKENRTDKLPKTNPGNPLLKRGDKVGFYFTPEGEKEMFLKGTVEIVDANGTFFNNTEPSYDILINDYKGHETLFKHNPQSSCYKINI